jgi:hypothetical protein
MVCAWLRGGCSRQSEIGQTPRAQMQATCGLLGLAFAALSLLYYIYMTTGNLFHRQHALATQARFPVALWRVSLGYMCAMV